MESHINNYHVLGSKFELFQQFAMQMCLCSKIAKAISFKEMNNDNHLKFTQHVKIVGLASSL